MEPLTEDGFDVAVEEKPVCQCLVLNAGSSSLKYALFDVVSSKEAHEVVSGLVEKIGLDMGRLKHEPAGKAKVVLDMQFTDHRVAMDKVIELLMDPETGSVKNKADIKVVGHRVVHGGESFTSAAVVTEPVMAAIEKAAALAPLHNPANITGIQVATQLFPCPQVAVFDTAFHMTMPPEAFMYAVPKELYKEHGIRRYGFHGSSYQYVLEATSAHLKVPVDKLNLIVCHLGNGASMAAIKNGKSVDTTMGLTPLDGLVMGTRSGDVDPALHLHLTKTKDMTLDQVNTMLNKASGLQGLCGDSDMRHVQEKADAGDADAKIALGVFIKRVRKYLGSFLVELGGNVDAIVFTAGIGENSAAVRQLACAGLENLGIALDQDKNNNKGAGTAEVHAANSKTKILVVPTNEELSITMQSVAQAQVEVVKGGRKSMQVARSSTDGRVSMDGRARSSVDGRARSSVDGKGKSFKISAKRVSVLMAKPLAAMSGAVEDAKVQGSSVYVVSLSGRGTALFEMGLFHRLSRMHNKIGFFRPISNRPNGQDTHVHLIQQVFKLKGDAKEMSAVDYDKALNMLSNGQESELVDLIIEAFEKYRHGKQFVLISGVTLPVQSVDMNFSFAAFMRSPVIMLMRYAEGETVDRMYQKVMLNKARLDDLPAKCQLSGVAINRVPEEEVEQFKADVTAMLGQVDVPVAAVLPFNSSFKNIRVNEIHEALNSTVLYGHDNLDRFETQDFVIAGGSAERTLQECSQRPTPSMVVVDARRADVLLALLFAIQSTTVRVAGVLLTGATELSAMMKQLMDGVPSVALPVLMVRLSLEECIAALQHLSPTVLPSSQRKIELVEGLFDKHMEQAYLDSLLTKDTERVMTPKLFQYQIMKKARSLMRHVVLPEGNDKRVVAAAAELVERGLCKVTLLGVPGDVQALANQLKVDLKNVDVVNPADSPNTQKYADLLFEARKEKGMTPEKALDLVSLDANFYGTMMMYDNAADGMVSGACHTTADTMRPALQVIKTAPGISLVSSVFFMLLPEQVYVYGDCAINVSPDAGQLADIAVSSANTARAFGITPRVALLSYATGESNTGDLITKVREATEKAKAMVEGKEQKTPIEGPLQFDAAVDPEVAKVKVKTESEVAGRANVCVFPDLNTGNNAYKAVQQASRCIAMGPIMQGLKKPVNDLSRGCTIDDIVNTVVITCIQSTQTAA